MKYRVFPAKKKHLKALQGRLRPADVEEILASSGRDPDEVLAESFRRSELCWVGLADGKAICLFGVARVSLLSTVGVPWMLGSSDLDRAGIRIARLSCYYLDKMKERFSCLVNLVDARHEASIRWLRWCGFVVMPAEPAGVVGLPFHRFWMKGALYV